MGLGQVQGRQSQEEAQGVPRHFWVALRQKLSS